MSILLAFVLKELSRHISCDICRNQSEFSDYHFVSKLMVVSREAKKKQHARGSSGLHDHYSELFTQMEAPKF